MHFITGACEKFSEFRALTCPVCPIGRCWSVLAYAHSRNYCSIVRPNCTRDWRCSETIPLPENSFASKMASHAPGTQNADEDDPDKPGHVWYMASWHDSAPSVVDSEAACEVLCVL